MKLLVPVLLAAVLASAADKRVVQPEGTPAGLPFSMAVRAGDTLYVSGQVGSDPKTRQIPDGFEDEVKQCIENIRAILKADKADLDDVVAVQVYLTDMSLFPRMNAVYTSYFREPRPARTTVGVSGLVGKARIEITVTARP